MSKSKIWLTLFGSLVLALGLVAAGCGDDDDDDDVDVDATEEDESPTEAEGDETPAEGDETETPDEGEEPSGTDTRQEGGDLILHFLEPEAFDPHSSNFATDISFDRMVWRGMYSLDAENNVVFDANGIASGDPEVSEDGLTVTVTLNEGLVWSDGDDLTAEDYVAGVKRTCNPLNTGYYAYLFIDIAPITGCGDLFNALVDEEGNDVDPASVDLGALEDAMGVTAVDPQTVEFTLDRASPTFPIILSLWVAFPVPTHLDRFASAAPGEFPDWGSDPAELAYNGPYVWTGYEQANSITVEPNPEWSGAVQPTLDTIELRLIDDAAVANNAYRNDELQVALADTSQLEVLRSEFGDGEEFFLFPSPSTRGLEMQVEDETLADVNVRLALSKAIDREALNTVVAQGGNFATTSWIPEEVSGVPIGTFDEATGFDPEGAAALLEEAGFPGGEGFPVLTILVGDSAAARATAEFLQQGFLETLGIDVEIEAVDSATRSSRFNAEDFDLFPGGWIQDYPDMENWIVGLFDTDGGNNHYNCSDPEIDSLIAEALESTNNEERLDLYRQAEELIVTTVCGIAPYWHESNKYLIKPNLTGFAENSTGQDGVLAGDWTAENWGIVGE